MNTQEHEITQVQAAIARMQHVLGEDKSPPDLTGYTFVDREELLSDRSGAE